jgi:hypothetical protein
MAETFGHYLKTGSGSTIVRLIFADDSTATIEFDSRWMGSDLPAYRLHWHHYKVSDTYGFLALSTIERYITYDTDATMFEDIFTIVEDFAQGDTSYPVPYRDMTYEYLRLTKAQLWLADAPDLEQMRNFFNLAQWPETFDLVLWRHFSLAQCKGEWEDTNLTRVLDHLDKMKFTSQVDEEFSWPKRATSAILTNDAEEPWEQSTVDEAGVEPFLPHHEASADDRDGLDEAGWQSLLGADQHEYTAGEDF